MYVIGFVICGTYSLSTMGDSFFTPWVILEGMLLPCVYLLFLVINTRKSKVVTYALIDIFSICFLIFIHIQHGNSGSILWSWKYTAIYVCAFLTFPLSRFQGRRYLLAQKYARYHGHHKQSRYKPHSFKGRR